MVCDRPKPRDIFGFSFSIQHPKTAFAPLRHSAINQVLLALLFPQFDFPGLRSEKLKLLKSLLAQV